MNKVISSLLTSMLLVLFLGCGDKAPEKTQPIPKTTEIEKLTPIQIRDLAGLEKKILEKKSLLPDTIDSFKNGEYYQVIGTCSAPGQLPMKKKAADADAKRWGAILMKYLLRGEADLDLKGEFVDFLIFDGEFWDESNNTVYMIYRFKER